MEKNYESRIRSIEDFPKEGITFYDISPLLADPEAFDALIMEMAEPLRGNVDTVAGFDARGFLFATPLARELEVGSVMLRKPGKLPGELLEETYDLEYGVNSLALQVDSLSENERVVLVDDVIATGGTALAGVKLVQRAGAVPVEFLSVIDLPELGGSRRIADAGVAVRSVVSFKG